MKKISVPIIVGLLIGGVLSGGYLLWLKRSAPVQPIPQNQTVTATPTPEPLLTWSDPNGFTFKYPEGVAVNKHDEDKENYAHLEFTHPQHPGRLVVWGKDPARGVTDAASWVKNEKRFIGASVVDTQLGGQKAVKVMIDGITRILVTGAVYDNIVWSVEATLDDAAYWTGVHTTIANSLAFVPVKEPGSAASSDSAPAVVEDVAVDEEEVIE